MARIIFLPQIKKIKMIFLSAESAKSARVKFFPADLADQTDFNQWLRIKKEISANSCNSWRKKI